MKGVSLLVALAATLGVCSSASASAPTQIARAGLQASPDFLAQTVREQLTFVGCGGPGRLLVSIGGRRALSVLQRHSCQSRTVAWSSPGCAATGYLVLVRIKIGARPWSRRVWASAGAPGGGEVSVTLTSANLRQAMSLEPPLAFGAVYPGMPTIHVDDGTRYQQMTGFGAAMTDSSAWLLYDVLPPAGRQAAMDALFGPCGIAVNHVRVPIAASDFTAGGVPYSYDDMPTGETDPSLAHFSIAHDQAYVLPTLQMMLGLNPAVEILASPWSAPGWMKANDAPDNVNFAGVLLPDSYHAYAAYLVRFIQAYAQAGVPVAAITPMNEPHTASMYPGMDLDEDTFLADDLMPALRSAGLSTSVYGLDGSGLSAGLEMLSGPARSSFTGLAWHCYAGLEQMSQLHAADPSANLIMDEWSPGIVSYPTTEALIASARNYAQSVDLWNLALDPAGGPKQPAFGCSPCGGLITVQETTHTALLNLNYYQLGQVSKFVQRGAVRIASDRWVSDFSNPDGAYGITPGLDDVAFLNPDGSKVLVAYDDSSAQAIFQVAWDGRAFVYSLAPGATVTFTWR